MSDERKRLRLALLEAEEAAIRYARGDGVAHLAQLSGRDKDIAELGARRALFAVHASVFKREAAE